LTAPQAPPTTRIEESARALRYRLLLEWCRARGITDLLTAHQGDDQAETVAMRLMRGSGLEGLAGISARTERQGVRILRPLLEFTRAQLEASLRDVGQDWIEDPSNRDARFERNRWRSAMTPALSQSLRALARRFARDRVVIEKRLAAWLAAHARLDDGGVAIVDGGAFAALPDAIALRIAARLIGTVAGRDYPPRRAALSAALAQLRAGKNAAAGGCLLMRRGGQIMVVRELAAIAAAEEVMAGDQRHWDGRFALTAPCAGWLGPLGPQGWAEIRRLDHPQAPTPGAEPKALPAAAFWALPGLWSENSGNARKLLAIPDFLLLKHTGRAGFGPARLFPIAMRFLAHQPLAPAPFAIVLPAEAPIY